MKTESKVLLLLFLILLVASIPAYLYGPEPWLVVSTLTYALALPGSIVVGLLVLGLAWLISALGLGAGLFPIAEFLLAWTLCMLVAQFQVRIVRQLRNPKEVLDTQKIL